MTKQPDKAAEPPVQCDVCLKEIPRSVAQSLEGPDYVYHFCGADCYSKWGKHKQQGHADKK